MKATFRIGLMSLKVHIDDYPNDSCIFNKFDA